MGGGGGHTLKVTTLHLLYSRTRWEGKDGWFEPSTFGLTSPQTLWNDILGTVLGMLVFLQWNPWTKRARLNILSPRHSSAKSVKLFSSQRFLQSGITDKRLRDSLTPWDSPRTYGGCHLLTNVHNHLPPGLLMTWPLYREEAGQGITHCAQSEDQSLMGTLYWTRMFITLATGWGPLSIHCALFCSQPSYKGNASQWLSWRFLYRRGN